MRKRLKFVAAAFVLTIGAVVGVTPAQPAQASIADYQVCNSSASVGIIQVFGYQGAFGNTIVPIGQCRSGFVPVSAIRVDVDPETWGNYPDVDSYYIGVIGKGYGPCHQGENYISNPPDDAPSGVRYNTNQGSC